MWTHRGPPLLVVDVAEVVGSIPPVGPGAFGSDDEGDDLAIRFGAVVDNDISSPLFCVVPLTTSLAPFVVHHGQ